MAQSPVIELDVAVVGGGFAGVYCAKVLARHARGDRRLKAGVIAAENYMVFQPMLAEVAAGTLSPQHVINPIRQLCRGLVFHKGIIRNINASKRELHLSAGDFTPDISIRFRHLVVALGAVIDLSRVPGMPEHALLMQNVGDAMKLRATVLSRFEEASLAHNAQLRRQLLSFVVVGGGYSGVETAGELLDLMKDMLPYYAGLRPEDIKVTLIHSQDHLLPTLNRRLGEYALRKLQGRGLIVHLNRRAKAVTAQTVLLDDGTLIKSSTVVSTIGNAPHPVVVDLCQQLGLMHERGRLPTDSCLRVPGHDWLWAAGDCAAVPFSADSSQRICPATAQFAMRQGTLLGRNLLATLRGRDPLPFTFKGLGELAAIGHRTAVAEIMGLRFSGFPAWFMWRTIYLSKLPGIQRKLRVIVDWTFDLFFPRDINLLNPSYTRKLKAQHLEAGDILFNPGEPAFSLYFVKEGIIEIRDNGQIVKTVRAGDYFGERALLEDGIWRYQAIAVTATSLIALGAPEFKALIEGSNALLRLFTRSAQAYLSREDIEAMKSQLSKKTLAKSASDLMNRSLDTVTPSTSLLEAMALFKAKRHGSYPLVNADGILVGIIKRDDLFDYLKSHASNNGQSVMVLPHDNTLPITGEETSCEEIVELFLRSGRNKILVADHAKKLSGIITLLDLAEDSLKNEAVD